MHVEISEFSVCGGLCAECMRFLLWNRYQYKKVIWNYTLGQFAESCHCLPCHHSQPVLSYLPVGCHSNSMDQSSVTNSGVAMMWKIWTPVLDATEQKKWGTSKSQTCRLVSVALRSGHHISSAQWCILKRHSFKRETLQGKEQGQQLCHCLASSFVTSGFSREGCFTIWWSPSFLLLWSPHLKWASTGKGMGWWSSDCKVVMTSITSFSRGNKNDVKISHDYVPSLPRAQSPS